MKIVSIFFLSLLLSLSLSAQKLSEKKIEENFKKLNRELKSLQDSNSDLKKTVSRQQDMIEQFNKKLVDVKEELDNTANTVNSSISSMSQENSKINDRIDEIGSSISNNTLLFTLLCSALAVSGITGFLFLTKGTAKKSEPVVPETASPLTKVDRSELAERNGRDTEFLDVLRKTYSLLQEKSKNDSNTADVVDHSLPLKVGDEIHRMRKRIENIPNEVKGIGALKNSLNRLEEEINESGYVLVDLMGRDYNDGMISEARFVEDSSVPPGREIVTDVLKPQINYNGQLIQAAKIEVGKSYD